jgi:hypothetical protein
MAKTEKGLVKSLRSRGVKRSTAEELVRGAMGAAKPKNARRLVADLDSVVEEFKDRLSGGPQRRSAAAKKAARTRKLKARIRSEAAKRGARTRSRKG